MNWLFWLCLLVVAYAYAGYALLLQLTARPRPYRPGPQTPTVSVILTARNEAETLPAKLADLQAQTYPHELTERIIVSDGSTDGTAEAAGAEPGFQVLELSVARGKANALNLAADRANGEILVFFDARQRVRLDVIAQLVAPFADPAVGAVSGELMLVTASGEPDSDALGIYWRIEKTVRRLESASGSVVGVTGAIYAMRRRLFVPLPAGLILDDVWLPMHVARAGGRVLFLPAAVATDRLFTAHKREMGREWSRKVRTLTGNFELMRHAPWLLTPSNPLWFRFVSHKVLRLVVPYLLLVMLMASALGHGSLLHLALALQLLFFGLAAVGWLVPAARHLRAVGVPYTFTLLNAAAAVAAYKFLANRDVWTENSVTRQTVPRSDRG